MIVRCMVCSKASTVTKANKEYKRYASRPNSAHICEKCSLRIQSDCVKWGQTPFRAVFRSNGERPL